jgi:hypothetical protein
MWDKKRVTAIDWEKTFEGNDWGKEKETFWGDI